MDIAEAERLLERAGFVTERGSSILFAVHKDDPVPERRHRVARLGFQTVNGADVWSVLELKRRGWAS